jgi:hypothetical protein
LLGSAIIHKYDPISDRLERALEVVLRQAQ